MTILGIETSTAVCSVGLADVSGMRSESSIIESHIHSEKLLTLIQDLCNKQKIKLSQLDGIAVSMGPGSFTGLRIGLSTAKGLCFALEKPLLAVPTFASIARSVIISHPECERVIVCIDAKQREYYIGVYEHSVGTIRELSPVQIGDLSSAIASASLKTVIVTDQADKLKAEVSSSSIIEDVLPYCRGDVVAKMAIERSSAGDNKVWEQLEPMYLKDFVVRSQIKLEK
jgi:tRNA threonylcarbamoyladenosine biosynthesis protein TsaB